MAISYQSKDSAVLGLQLKVQELCVKLSDSAVVSAVGPVVTIDVKEDVKEVRAAMHCDDSAGSAGLLLIPSGDIVVTGSQIACTLTVAPTDADSIIIKYVVAE